MKNILKICAITAAACLLLAACANQTPTDGGDTGINAPIAGDGSAPAADTSGGALAQDGAQSPDAQQPAGTWQTISADAAYQMMSESSDYTLLDVRTQSEYDSGHIEGAALMPYDEIANRAQAELPDKSAVIIVYCRSGSRSSTAAATLAGMGYTNVYDMGGITSWTYGTVTGSN